MDFFLLFVGDGYCRSEGVVAIYLQKQNIAKRIYSTIVNSKTNSDGSKEQGNLSIINKYFSCF